MNDNAEERGNLCGGERVSRHNYNIHIYNIDKMFHYMCLDPFTCMPLTPAHATDSANILEKCKHLNEHLIL